MTYCLIVSTRGQKNMKLDNKQPYLMADIHYVLGACQKKAHYNKHVDTHQKNDISNSEELHQPQKHCCRSCSVRNIILQFLICLCVLLVLVLLLTSSDWSQLPVTSTLKFGKSRNSTIYNSTVMSLPTRREEDATTS